MDWFYVLICCGNGLEHMLELPYDKWVRNYTHALYCTIFLWVEITKKIIFFPRMFVQGIWSRVDQDNLKN